MNDKQVDSLFGVRVARLLKNQEEGTAPADPAAIRKLLIEVQSEVAESLHDFNNLLVGIEGNARLLLGDDMVLPAGEGLLRHLIDCVEKLKQGIEEAQDKYTPSPQEGEGSSQQADHISHSNNATAVLESAQDTIVVIDDEEIVRSVTREILTRAGYRVLLAANGEEGLAHYESNMSRICCVLLDLTMPFMSGNLVYAKLMAIDPDVRVIIMSGYSDQHALDQFDSGGIAQFLHKPFSPDDLIAGVKAVIAPFKRDADAESDDSQIYRI